jgi:hypothetical protein
VRETSGRGYSTNVWVLLWVLPAAALGCSVDDRISRASEGPEVLPGEAPNDGDTPGLAGSGSMGGGAAGSGSAGSGSAGAGGAGPAAAGGAGGGTAGAGTDTEGGASGAAGAPVVTPSAGCGEQLLTNGDFDAGRTGWEETWDVQQTVIARTDPRLLATGVTPHSGDYLGWLGGVRNGEFGEKYLSRLSQMVTLPETTVSLTFSGYIWVTQPELGVTPTSDWAVLEFLDPLVTEGYDDLWQIDTWGDENVSAGWVPFSLVQTMQMDRFRGRTLPIVADSRPDGNGTLSVFLDSLRLEARCE